MSIELAKETLKNNNLTCVIANENEVIFKSNKKGVTPLMDYIIENHNGEFYLADKVIGKAAALLCLKANIKHVFTTIISTPAIAIFKSNNISFEYIKEVPRIKNRDGTSLCPMESLSEGISDYNIMFDKIYKWLNQRKLI